MRGRVEERERVDKVDNPSKWKEAKVNKEGFECGLGSVEWGKGDPRGVEVGDVTESWDPTTHLCVCGRNYLGTTHS